MATTECPTLRFARLLLSNRWLRLDGRLRGQDRHGCSLLVRAPPGTSAVIQGCVRPSSRGCAVATAALSAFVAGHWTGYIENLVGGDDAVDLTIAVASDGTLSGQLTIGTETPPVPATDGTVGWPPWMSRGLDTVPPAYLSGFKYTGRDMSWVAKRLKIRLPTFEPWEPWCTLQQSYPTPDGYRCYPAGELAFTREPFTQLPLEPALDAAGNCHIDTDPSVTTDPLVRNRLHPVRDVQPRPGLRLLEPAELQLRWRRRV